MEVGQREGRSGGSEVRNGLQNDAENAVPNCYRCVSVGHGVDTVGNDSKVICVLRPLAQSLLVTRPNAVGSWEQIGNRVANLTPTPLLFQCKAVSTHLPE